MVSLPLASTAGAALGVPALAVLPWALAGALAAAAGGALAVALGRGRRLRAAAAAAAAAEQRARRLLGLLERDRYRLGQALHDGPVQDLLAHEMAAGVAAHLGGRPEAPSADVAGVVRQLRAMSEGLRPPALEAFGLAAAVGAHADRFQAAHPGIAVALDLDPVALDGRVGLALFRVVQESLHNAALHGPPRHVEIALEATAAGAALTVVDDGPGYDVPADAGAFARSGRYGVLGMLAHAEAVGATLRLESAPGRTAVRVDAPASAPPPA